MSNGREGDLDRADSYESSARLTWGFIGALTVAVTAKVLGGSRDGNIWLGALLVVLIVTAYGQGVLASAYNGLVVGLFYNFFFVSRSQELSFHSFGDVGLEGLFVVVGVVTGLLGRWKRKRFAELEAGRPTDPKEEGHPYVWRSQDSEGRPHDKRERSWTW